VGNPIFKYFILLFLLVPCIVKSQRNYANNSVLAQGDWYKIAISKTGVYKIDVSFLNNIGINTNNLQSNTIAIFGNTGKMLNETLTADTYDDLKENAIEMFDGGDGIFNGNDYFLFYGVGTSYWEKDSLNKTFFHKQNLYSNEAYYFITLKPNAKRITVAPIYSTFTQSTSTTQFQYFLEEEKENLLLSGKNWVGQQLSQLPGYQLSKTYEVALPNRVLTAPMQIKSALLARNGINSNFQVFANNSLIQTVSIPAVTGNLFDAYSNEQISTTSFNNTNSNQSLNFTYNSIGGTAQGWLNYFEIHCASQLKLETNNQLFIKDWNTVFNSSYTQFNISNSNQQGFQVWNVTNPLNPEKQNGTLIVDNYSFIAATSNLKEFVCFANTQLLTPVFKLKVINQNLHGETPVNYLLITDKIFFNNAKLLEQYYNSKSIKTKLITTEQIYNEFGCGIADVTAIRDCIKMFYDKSLSSIHPLQNVLLLGGASFDYKNTNLSLGNMVPTWESESSFHPLTTYNTDDYFGYLTDNDNINSNFPIDLKIGIGRVPARSNEDVLTFFQKIKDYEAKESFGIWRNQLTYIADDEDGNLHVNDAETISNTSQNTNTSFNNNKIYIDAFEQTSTNAGSRYPNVNNLINNTIQNGSLIMNYNGHGSNSRLADEAILTEPMVNSWTNKYKLPLFITATCDFATFDRPNETSLGEKLLLKNNGGAIALMTTTRIVFAFSNRIINNNYLLFALKKNSLGQYPNLGTANLLSKNYTVQNGGDIINARKFTLLGDPYLTLAFPKNKVITTKINDQNFTPSLDTIQPNDIVKLEGEVRNGNNTLIQHFNGIVKITVYDKKVKNSTLKNDANSNIALYETNGNILFNGTATVLNGKFKFEFIAPKDIQAQIGFGYITYYASADSIDANGNDSITMGGNILNLVNDNIGPEIKIFLKDESFVDGGITNQNPLLIVHLNDSSGINVSNLAVGHDIEAFIDNNLNNKIVLNDYFTANQNTFKNGKLQYQLPELSLGKHTLTIKAWDVVNNVNSKTIHFEIIDNNEIVIRRLYNYPNPFTTKTNFWWEINRTNEPLEVEIKILSSTGKIVKVINEKMINESNNIRNITWDGKDMYNKEVATGVYIYILTVKTKEGKKNNKIEKIYKL
jgi:hypothetical protein